MNLSDIKSGKKVTIVSLKTPSLLTQRLVSIGLFPGAEVEVVRASNAGDVVLKFLDSRFALGGSLTRSIEVRSQLRFAPTTGLSLALCSSLPRCAFVFKILIILYISITSYENCSGWQSKLWKNDYF